MTTVPRQLHDQIQSLDAQGAREQGVLAVGALDAVLAATMT
jgi:hypothetical protein